MQDPVGQQARRDFDPQAPPRSSSRPAWLSTRPGNSSPSWNARSATTRSWSPNSTSSASGSPSSVVNYQKRRRCTHLWSSSCTVLSRQPKNTSKLLQSLFEISIDDIIAGKIDTIPISLGLLGQVDDSEYEVGPDTQQEAAKRMETLQTHIREQVKKLFGDAAAAAKDAKEAHSRLLSRQKRRRGADGEAVPSGADAPPAATAAAAPTTPEGEPAGDPGPAQPPAADDDEVAAWKATREAAAAILSQPPSNQSPPAAEQNAAAGGPVTK